MKKITKSFLLLTTLFFAISFVNTAHSQCLDPDNLHTFTGSDSYGDGWNGGSVDILVNGTSVLSSAFTVSGASGSTTFLAQTGDQITLVWVNGSWPGEISFSISNPNGETIATGSYDYEFPTGPFTASGCPVPAGSCAPPGSLSATSITADSATVTWVDNTVDGSDSIDVEYTDTNGTATTINDVSSPYTITGLSSNTTYTFNVTSNCATGSEISSDASFATIAACGDSVSYTYESSFDGLAYSFSAPSGQYASVTMGGETESNYDFMYITDGSGNDLYGSSTSLITGPLSGTYESTDGTILIYVVSDGSVTKTMTFAFSCYDPPSSAPDCATNFTDTVDANCGNEDFSISWDAVADATGYLLTAGTTSGGTDIEDAFDLGTLTSYSFTGVVADQSYYYTVTPYNSAGNAEACEEQSATTVSTVCTPCDSATALTPGTQQSGDTVQFDDTFSDNSCLGSYDSGDDAVYSYVATEDGETMTVTVDFTATYGGVSMSLGCPSGDSTAYTCVGSATGSSSGVKSFTSDALVAGETYYIHISTWAAPQSTAYTLDTTVIAAPACLDPTALEAASITTDSADISWTSADSSFNIEVVDVTGGGAATGVATYSGVTSPYALTGLLDNNAYIVYVQTDCGADLSEWVSTGFTTLPFPIIPDYTNDFSIFPGDLWSIETGVLNSFGSWISDGFANNGTTGSARINIYTSSYSGPQADDSLISPVFDLSGGAYYLNMQAALTPWNATSDGTFGQGDYISVSLTEDGGVTWIELFRWDSTNAPPAAGAAMPEQDLSNYTSSTVKFKIFAQSGTGIVDNDFFIDNFSITSSSLGINNSQISQFTYFPNPVNDQLTINAQTSVDDIAVLNMLGQVVSRQSPNSLNCVVDMAALRTGVYFVQVSIGNNTETVRVLKQ